MSWLDSDVDTFPDFLFLAYLSPSWEHSSHSYHGSAPPRLLSAFCSYKSQHIGWVIGWLEYCLTGGLELENILLVW
jgi:hypothetical protein